MVKGKVVKHKPTLKFKSRDLHKYILKMVKTWVVEVAEIAKKQCENHFKSLKDGKNKAHQ